MTPLRKVAWGIVLVLVALAGLRWGPAALPALERALGIGEPVWVPAPHGSGPAQPSLDLADATLDRFERFRGGEGEDRLALGSTELSSVLRYALPGLMPAGISDPTVHLQDGRVHVRARVAREALPRIPDLGQVMAILPDTVLLEMVGTLSALDQAFLALHVDRIEVSRVPIPQRLVAGLLAGLGREGPPGLRSDAIAVPIPDGVKSVVVRRDSLVLEARR